jgi:hypothetical protein
MPAPSKYTLGVPYYSQVEFITDTTATYRMLYFVRNVESEQEKWYWRVYTCCLVIVAIDYICES